MKIQLVILAIAVIGSIRSAPQNEAAIEDQGEEMAVSVAERTGADESISDYQNDNNYRYYQYYRSKGINMMYMSPYYVSQAAYNKKATDLAQCQKERDSLIVVQSAERLRTEAVVEEDESDEEKEEVQVAPMCTMKVDPGPCTSYIQRYYYNEDTQRCEMFVYGGCLGNTNNFRTEYECENSCMNQCSRPLNVGYCSARLPRYYYNSATGRCQLFYYGGCGGNSNNFMTMQECQTSCDGACILPKEKGPCRDAVPRWYHNSETNKCEPFIYSGCGGNTNNFLIRSAPQNEAAIEGQEEEMAVGVAERKGADESISDYQNDNNYRYYQYYGSKGTNMMYTSPYYISQTAYNKMATDLAQCQRERDSLIVVQSAGQQEAEAVVEEDESDEEKEELKVDSMCTMKADSGPCRSYFQRYYYNEDRQRCEMFVYGGCLGNTNNFRTKYECENSCMNQCSRPLNVGYCSASLPRYYYNSATGRCQLFYYGGCGGNTNNFM
ncbi:kunitz-type serine protease inhibitor 6-like [Watersipora subatra]|uniref:kunitz-type serine protease inhibitor 6-like n=1 Tax=Watersipora subatra TaxID=2589382 RepID=UPI00355C7D50